MLTRPLAYKGPIDHLSQHFQLDSLYKGLQLLLDDLLMDWQFVDEEHIQGVFLQEGQLLKASLAWPLTDLDNNFCQCESKAAHHKNPNFEQAACEHLAALAIESKVKLERLPPPLKQAQILDEAEDYLEDWFAAQQFDPFPNMARHRVAYVLSGEPGDIHLSLHKAYLSQQDAYSLKANLPLNIISKGKLPKFISLADQHLLRVIDELLIEFPTLKLAENQLRLDKKTSPKLLPLLLDTNRCFWRSVHRHPLSASSISPEELEESLFDLWKLDEQYYLDRSGGLILQQLDKSQQAKVDKLQQLNEQGDGDFKPLMTLVSEPTSATNFNPLDIAKISFIVAGSNFSLLDFCHWQQQSDEQSGWLLDQVIHAMRQLESLPSIKSRFETPVWSRFDLADRLLDGDLSHWFILLRGLQLEDWQITIAPSFSCNPKIAADWYSLATQQSPQRQKKQDKKVSQGSSQDSSPMSYLEDGVENDWFDLEIGIKVDGKPVNLLPIIVKALRQGQWQNLDPNGFTQVILENEQSVSLDNKRLIKILANLVELSEARPLNKKARLTLPSNQATRLLQMQEDLEAPSEWQDLIWLKEKAERLSTISSIEAITEPKNLQAELRDYQRQGLSWLQFLRKEKLAGILADDMGLGKTLQTLAHIQLEKNAGRLISPCLIVAPTSLLANWQAEAKRFTPELNIIRWAGNQRFKLTEQLSSADLIITSYGLLSRDAADLQAAGIYLLVLDEAQMIKNSRSQVAKTCYAFKATFKLCLSGTPMENHLGELWSLFHFLMPNFLGSQPQFNRQFRSPIEKEGDLVRQKQLAQRVAPLMLRRTKAAVAKDLPQKTEIRELIDLSQSQADLYESMRLGMMEQVQKALQSNLGRDRFLVGNLLLRLRQICCHPHLIRPDDYDRSVEHSAKLDWLATVLPEMIESGRRLLIFSSFTGALEVIATLLESMQIDYLKLTGQSRNRGDLVEKFQAGEVPVFLISLKAGGSGLNLTRADTVIHFDPWWNPAAEEQASDRAHRIGQDKPVFVYKLIAKGTVEERIQQMQARKASLADKLYAHSEQSDVFSQADWSELFAPLE